MVRTETSASADQVYAQVTQASALLRDLPNIRKYKENKNIFYVIVEAHNFDEI